MNSDRAALVERHLDLARRAARLYHPRVREHVELDELVALASVGLVEAANRYDPAQGASFRTFAWYRVQGAIIDGLRRMTNLPRKVWARIVVLRATAEYLEAQAARADAARVREGERTAADKLREVKDAIGAIRTMYVVSIDTVPDDQMADDVPPVPEQLGRRRQAAQLAAALAQLPERERILLDKHYREGKTLLDAGAELGLSKSWASRLHARAVDRLRELMGPADAPAGADPPGGASAPPPRPP
ncbi:MAG TPA: sigma-70 family RNA polymerase sigma factor [Kofleriaceae bacterium]|nr:sigma-70 family RNA polymerase sigma factor [Kofleriaceae bacterium]